MLPNMAVRRDIRLTIAKMGLRMESLVVKPDECNISYHCDNVTLFREDIYVHRRLSSMRIKMHRSVSAKTPPTSRNYCAFLTAVCEAFSLCNGTLIAAWIYLQRYLRETKGFLYETSWRPLFFCALLLAHKMWDDVVYKNYRWVYLYPTLEPAELWACEKHFFGVLDMKLGISASQYRKETRDLFDSKNSPIANSRPSTTSYLHLPALPLSSTSTSSSSSSSLSHGGPHSSRSCSQLRPPEIVNKSLPAIGSHWKT
eukprot:GILJ01012339.1.p1 GENE.GILJ01012339.1~~GILJ01012339.1.p1  ORF type:complete len:256 (-),score=5.05 GILJ01012339.1:70-837(-)